MWEGFLKSFGQVIFHFNSKKSAYVNCIYSHQGILFVLDLSNIAFDPNYALFRATEGMQ